MPAEETPCSSGLLRGNDLAEAPREVLQPGQEETKLNPAAPKPNCFRNALR
jgi:hypothetical protein